MPATSTLPSVTLDGTAVTITSTSGAVMQLTATEAITVAQRLVRRLGVDLDEYPDAED